LGERSRRSAKEWCRLLPAAVGVFLVALVAAATPVLASRVDSAAGTTAAPVEAKVMQEIEASGKTAFWVVLDDKADLGAASRISDRAERGRYVFNR
jgi:hypothetical protein